jgi:hypothetical protein
MNLKMWMRDPVGHTVKDDGMLLPTALEGVQ